MSNTYIEQDDVTTYGCGCTSTSCGCNGGSGDDNTGEENPDDKKTLGMYDYLNDFDSWSDDEKLKLFLPMVEFYYRGDVEKKSTGSDMTQVIANITKATGRAVDKIDFTISHQGILTAMIVFKPLEIRKLPTAISKPILSWARKNKVQYVYNAYHTSKISKVESVDVSRLDPQITL
ncbi:hypothetical protein [Bacteroides acidifaciens]|uniref:hypothetical protein n=1 Tax=Bacteroides acidifaciens TaxID=85831 RepID=UPI00263B86F2|nr:hypothetical protein [Bacteroides acidifaciens]